MTKIIIVDYSLEIVIAIINNNYFEQIYAIVWSCMPNFCIKYIYNKTAENTLPELLLLFYSSGFQLQSSRPPRSAHFACLCCLNTPDSDHQLIRRKFHEWTVFPLTCSLHSVHCSLLPKHEKSVDVYFTSELIYSLIYSRICATASVITHRRNLLVKCDKIYLCK